MKNKKLFLRIYISLLIVMLISMIVLSILGKKERIGYLSDFKFDENHINKTLELNGFNVDETKKLFTSNNILDNEALTNYIFSNESITNYSYGFRIRYYDKVFRNSDIYGVYIDTNKIMTDNNFIKEIKMDRNGSPFGNFVSDKIIDFEKIDNIQYILKIKPYIIILLLVLVFLPLTFYLTIKFVFPIFLFPMIDYFIEYLSNFLEKNLKNLDPNNLKSNNFNTIYIVVFLLFSPLIFLFYWNISLSIPYYYAWDSSLIYSRDILLSYLNIIPGHMLHPNLVSLVLYKWIFLPIGMFFNIIPPINLQTFQNSLNPYLYLIDITEYIFNVNIIIMFMFIIMMYINIIKIFKIENITNNKVMIFVFSISILIILSFSNFMTNSIIYQIIVIRYDSIAFLLGSISLYFIILSSETRTCYEKKHIIYIVLSSIFIGGALLSKFQMASWLFILFFIYLALNIDKFILTKENINIKKSSKLLYIFTLSFITINIIASYLFFYKKIYQTIYLYDINFNYILFVSILVSTFFILLCIFTIKIKKKEKININNSFKIILNNLIYYILTSFLPILSALLLPKGLDIFFNVWIMIYNGGVLFLSLFRLNWENSSYPIYGKNVVIIAIIMILIFITVAVYIFKRKKLIKNKILTINLLEILLNIFLLTVSLFLLKGLRISSNKDLIIASTIILISFLVFIRTIILYLSKYKIIILNIFIFILFIFSAKSLFFIYKNNLNFIGINNNTYFYNLEYWKTHVSGYSYDISLKNMLDNTYTNNNIWNTLFFWSRNIQSIKNLLKQIEIKNNQIYNTIIAEQGSFVSSNKNESITLIDKYISGGLILPIYNETKFQVFARADYDFYFISDIEIKVVNNNEIELTDYNFYINNNIYFVYKIKTGSFFYKEEDFMNRCFILISDRLAKGL